MTSKNVSKTNHSPIAPAGKSMLIGAGISFLLIALFLAGAGEGDPDWPKYWIVKPLLMVPISGALGGLFFYFMSYLFSRGGWEKVLSIAVGLIGYLIIIWLGTVLGLNGTMWN